MNSMKCSAQVKGWMHTLHPQEGGPCNLHVLELKDSPFLQQSVLTGRDMYAIPDTPHSVAIAQGRLTTRPLPESMLSTNTVSIHNIFAIVVKSIIAIILCLSFLPRAKHINVKLKKRIAVYNHWTGQVDWTRLLHRSEHLYVTFMWRSCDNVFYVIMTGIMLIISR